MLGEIMAVLAYVLFKVTSGSERDVCQKLIEFDEVLHADIIFGEYDVVAKVEMPELNNLEEFISLKIRNVSNVLVTSTMIVSREYKGKKHRLKTA
jgi:DNA-binding Lrp family transcriptional regulator